MTDDAFRARLRAAEMRLREINEAIRQRAADDAALEARMWAVHGGNAGWLDILIYMVLGAGVYALVSWLSDLAP